MSLGKSGNNLLGKKQLGGGVPITVPYSVGNGAPVLALGW